MSKNKVPKSQPTSVTKKPRSQIVAESGKFTWSFALIDFEGPFGWKKLEQADLLEILSKKKELESKTNTELREIGCHLIEKHKLIKPALARLEELKLDDLDALFSMRITGKKRVWCVRHDHIMRVLWWDPEHAICPSQLKNT